MYAKTSWLLVAILLSLFMSATAFAQDATPPADEVAENIVEVTVDVAESTATTLEDFLNRLTTTPQSELARVLLVVGGVVLLVAGWRIYDFVVILAGLVIGASVAVALVTTDNQIIIIAAMLIGGLIGAFLSAFVYVAAVFLIGAYIGIVLTSAITTALGFSPVALVLLMGAVIGGLVLIGLSFEFLVLLSSVVGAQMLSLGLGLGIVWTLLFAIIGVVIQLGLMRSFNYNFRRRRTPWLRLRRT